MLDLFTINEKNLDQNILDAYRSTKSIEPIPKISIRIMPRDIRVIFLMKRTSN